MKRMYRTLAPALFAVTMLAGGNAAHAHVCDDPKAAARDAVIAAYEPKIAEIRAFIQAAEQMPQTPVRDAILEQLRNALATAEEAKNGSIDQAVQVVGAKCTQELEPIQDAIDAITVTLTGGLSKLLPARMFHIEAGEILDGNLMGNENSVVRDIINKKLGLPW